MYAFDPQIEMTTRLKDVDVFQGEIKDVQLMENGDLVTHSLIHSSSGNAYKLGTKIDEVQKGKGMICKVYVLKDNNHLDYQNPLAAKIYPFVNIQNNKSGDDFVQEIAIQAALTKSAQECSIDGFVTFIECIATNDCLLLLMPFYNKKDLFYFIDKHPGLIAVEECKRIFRGLVQGIAHMHDLGYVHRDVSCENVYYDSKTDTSATFAEKESMVKRVKREAHDSFDLGDFGMSVHYSQTRDLSTKIGKPSYKAPELVKGILSAAEIDWKSCDVWALGIVLHLLLMKCFPFSSARESDNLFIDRVLKKKIEFRGQQELCRSCYRSFDKDREERLAGLALVQKILAFKAADRPTAFAVLSDPWLMPSTHPTSNSVIAAPTVASTACSMAVNAPSGCVVAQTLNVIMLNVEDEISLRHQHRNVAGSSGSVCGSSSSLNTHRAA